MFRERNTLKGPEPFPEQRAEFEILQRAVDENLPQPHISQEAAPTPHRLCLLKHDRKRNTL